MNTPSNPSKTHLSLNINSDDINKQFNLSLSQQHHLHIQPPSLPQTDSPQLVSNPQKIKYGIQIITANPEDETQSSSSQSARQQNKALLGANFNPTINPNCKPSQYKSF